MTAVTNPHKQATLLTLMVLLIIGGIVLVIVQATSRAPDSSTGRSQPVLQQVTAGAVPTGTVELAFSDRSVVVRIPPNAVSDTGTWAMSPQQPETFSAPNEVWKRLQVVNLQLYDHSGKVIPEPKIITPLQLCFSLNQDSWASYRRQPSNFQVQHYETVEGHVQWRNVPYQENEGQKQLCADASKLSLFAAAMLAVQPTAIPTRPPLYSP